MDVVFFHGRDQHGAGDGTTERCGVEVSDAPSTDMKSATLDRGNAFVCKLGAAIDQARFGGAVFHRFARNFVVIGFVGLA